jgi:pyruvate-formate lyase-activating enzyme
MSLWRRTALEKFPSLRREIAEAEGPDGVWFEISNTLRDLYYHRQVADIDETFTAAVFEYASWCLNHRDINIRTAVVLSFYEDLPEHHFLSRELARWMSQEDFDLLEFAWKYVLKDEELVAAFQREFAEKKAELGGYGGNRHKRK